MEGKLNAFLLFLKALFAPTKTRSKKRLKAIPAIPVEIPILDRWDSSRHLRRIAASELLWAFNYDSSIYRISGKHSCVMDREKIHEVLGLIQEISASSEAGHLHKTVLAYSLVAQPLIAKHPKYSRLFGASFLSEEDSLKILKQEANGVR